MLTRVFTSIALILFLFASSAAADSNDIGMAHSEAFAKACAAGDTPGVLALYEDDATVIWPNEAEVAQGKDQIEKLARALSANPAFPLPSSSLRTQSKLPRTTS
jgi:hypothetical protein